MLPPDMPALFEAARAARRPAAPRRDTAVSLSAGGGVGRMCGEVGELCIELNKFSIQVRLVLLQHAEIPKGGQKRQESGRSPLVLTRGFREVLLTRIRNVSGCPARLPSASRRHQIRRGFVGFWGGGWGERFQLVHRQGG